MGKLQDWEMVMQYQRKNGSLFNSPSTTAVAFMHRNDDRCFNYLRSLLQKFDSSGSSDIIFCFSFPFLMSHLFLCNFLAIYWCFSVPTIYPLDIYARLHMVDSLQKLGIDRHFKEEIRSVLDETYR